MVVEVVIGAVLHKLVEQQLMLAIPLKRGMLLLLLLARAHRFADAQPRVLDVTEPIVTVDEK